MWSSNKHVLSGDSISDCRFDADTGACWTDSLTFAAGETKTFQVSLDWSRANIAKDFSVTAWGTSGDVSVRCADGMETDHMPQYTDDKSNVDPPIPVPDPEPDENDGDDGGDGDGGIVPNPDPTCQNIDGDLVDPYGDNCAAYEANPGYCYDIFDKTIFDPEVLCCICGGGEGEADDDEEEGGDEGECQNLDEGLVDADGDNCTAYEGTPAWCEMYEWDYFKPKELCCVCGGGYTPDGGDGDEEEQDGDGDEEEQDGDGDEEE